MVFVEIWPAKTPKSYTAPKANVKVKHSFSMKQKNNKNNTL